MEGQIIMIIVLIMSVVLHEVAHGYAAYSMGDPTAKLQGRLTLNPIPHLDPVMSVLLPGLLLLSGSPFVFGAARPVPYNPYNLSDQRFGEAKVAAAGPAVNILIAVVFGLLIRLREFIALPEAFIGIAFSIIILNIFLAFFNLLPVPPLDGSKILPIFLPLRLQFKYREFMRRMEQNMLLSFGIIFFVVVIFLGGLLYQATLFAAQLLAGY